jgi:hypothetical protein
MALLATYAFVLRDGEVVKGTTMYADIRAEERQPEFSGCDMVCDLDHVEVVTTSDERFTPKIFWSNDIFGPKGNGELLLEHRNGHLLDIGLFHVREGQTWLIQTEPTLDDRIGVAISNESGKTLFTGVGDLTPVEFIPLREGLEPKSGHVFTFVFNSVYNWRHSSPFGSAHTSGADRVNSPSVYPDYSAPDGGIPDAGHP